MQTATTHTRGVAVMWVVGVRRDARYDLDEYYQLRLSNVLLDRF